MAVWKAVAEDIHEPPYTVFKESTDVHSVLGLPDNGQGGHLSDVFLFQLSCLTPDFLDILVFRVVAEEGQDRPVLFQVLFDGDAEAATGPELAVSVEVQQPRFAVDGPAVEQKAIRRGLGLQAVDVLGFGFECELVDLVAYLWWCAIEEVAGRRVCACHGPTCLTTEGSLRKCTIRHGWMERSLA